MTDTENSRCHKIIHSASVAAGGVGAIGVFPLSDAIPLAAIQLKMIHSLAKVFGLNLTDEAARATLAVAAAAAGGRQLTKLFTCWMPVFGSLVSASTAAGITEAIGWTIASEFDREARRAA
jgi:uncharacterized protein (DUF697 family)